MTWGRGSSLIDRVATLLFLTLLASCGSRTPARAPAVVISRDPWFNEPSVTYLPGPWSEGAAYECHWDVVDRARAQAYALCGVAVGPDRPEVKTVFGRLDLVSRRLVLGPELETSYLFSVVDALLPAPSGGDIALIVGTSVSIVRIDGPVIDLVGKTHELLGIAWVDDAVEIVDQQRNRPPRIVRFQVGKEPTIRDAPPLSFTPKGDEGYVAAVHTDGRWLLYATQATDEATSVYVIDARGGASSLLTQLPLRSSSELSDYGGTHRVERPALVSSSAGGIFWEAPAYGTRTHLIGATFRPPVEPPEGFVLAQPNYQIDGATFIPVDLAYGAWSGEPIGAPGLPKKERPFVLAIWMRGRWLFERLSGDRLEVRDLDDELLLDARLPEARPIDPRQQVAAPSVLFEVAEDNWNVAITPTGAVAWFRLATIAPTP